MTTHKNYIGAVKIMLAGFVLAIMGAPLSIVHAQKEKIDDWQFTPQSYTSVFTLNLPPFPEYWYAYVVLVLAFVLCLIPIGIFFHGLYLFFSSIRDKEYRSRGTHKIALGISPVVAISALILFIFLLTGGSLNARMLFVALNLFFLTSFIGSIVLLIRGIYVWIRYRALVDWKKCGRMKTFFAVYSIIIILALWNVVYYSAKSVVSFPANRTGSVSFDSSVGNVQYFNTSQAPPPAADTSIGLSVGGAKDIDNFRKNIKNNYLPIPTDVTHEGLFYDYLFDTGIQKPCEKLFCPSYSTAVSKDPFSGEQKYFLSIGLNSGVQQKDFARRKTNFLVVLDISGSMGEQFNRYYYDRFGQKQSVFDNQQDEGKTKMEIAAESINDMLGHLTGDDSFGMALFDDISYVAKPLRKVSETDMERIKKHISELKPQGGTNMSAGMQEALWQFEAYRGTEDPDFENRVIFLTDAMPNTGDTTEEGMFGIAKRLAEQKIYTTFVGVDFNTELIESISKIRGANYYSVHSAKEFKKRMDEGFDSMVTPLVFNLNLEIIAPGFQIEKVYGSPEADETTGEIMKVNTLFPSEQTEGETRGGLVLLQLKRFADDATAIMLRAKYESRQGDIQQSDEMAFFKEVEEYYDNFGIRKGIVLARYANILRDWMFYERAQGTEEERKIVRPASPVEYYDVEGIPIVSPEFTLGKWERQSQVLRVSDTYKNIFTDFIPYMITETEAIGDQALQKELDVLGTILSK
ncbi:VWA domain-containing protein [Candidatus Uhrbacteria bacterium]|nr:VWA domain-containing protein [Candidatus Uhrbacteria bacterium]